jgi:AraC-like DNA-binding protein
MRSEPRPARPVRCWAAARKWSRSSIVTKPRTLRKLLNGPEPSAQDYGEGFPSPPLAAYVLCWSVHRIDARSISYLHRSAPNGSVELVCEVGGQPLLVGPQTGPLVRTLSPGATIVSLRLRPESAAAVLGMPACEVADQIVPLEDVLPATRFLCERIAAEPERAVAALEDAVSAQLARRAAADPMVAFGVERLAARANRVSSVADCMFMSERQLRRRFKAAVGLSPKTLERVLRFQRFLAVVHTGGWSRLGLARTAAALGYADQAHLTRESVYLSGLPPAELIRQSDIHCRGRHDHSPSFRALLGGTG